VVGKLDTRSLDDGGTRSVFDFLKSALEAALGSAITETGRGLGGGDPWFTWQGREYFVHIEPSGNQVRLESN